MFDNETSDVIQALEKLHSQLEDLILIVESNPQDKVLIRERYGVLKVKLKNSQKKASTDKCFSNATEIEKSFYFPAVCEAANSLNMAIGSKVNESFISSLYDAQDRISFYLNNLKSVQ